MTAQYVPHVSDWVAQHEGTQHLAVNNTWLRRLGTRLALRTVGKLYKRNGLCVPISKHKIIKAGFRINLTEAATMKYLAENTTLPVPKVYCSFVHKGTAYIVMERIRGDGLWTLFRDKAPENQVEDIFTQLRTIIQELRALVPPDAGVESCIGGSLFDSRLPWGNPRFGPFETIQDFHLWLRKGLRPEDLQDRPRDQDWHDLQGMMKRQDGPWPPPVFTHGDLNPSNILIRKGKVVGIIDWEFSGWYPCYWEYMAAWLCNVMMTDWQADLERFLERPNTEDFEMEQVRFKWWSDC